MAESASGVASIPVKRNAPVLRGSFRILFLFDVAEGFDLAKARELLGSECIAEPTGFPRRTPEYVRFAQPPVVLRRESLILKTGERLSCWVKYYAFAVAALEIEVPFACDWTELLAQGSRWMDAADVEPVAKEFVEQHLRRIGPAVVRPNARWLHESYLIVNLQEIERPGGERPGGERPTGTELLETRGGEIVKLIRGELVPLAPKTTEEALQASLSYYPADLVVIGSSGALVYDGSEDAVATMQVLEFAKMQLLEFRYYDNWMSQLLSDIYTLLDRKQNFFLGRWSLPREAQRINALRLDVMDLTERIDNAIKFFSDVYYARVYRLAAGRIGVTEYRELVEEKVRTAGELYDFMVDQFNETRSFILEVAVTILAVIDVIFLFKR